MKNPLAAFSRRIATPGYIPEKLAMLVSYLTILFLFPIDFITGPQVSLHVFYIFPLILISLHCSNKLAVIAALVEAIVFQIIALLPFAQLSLTIKMYLALMIIFSNCLIVVISRYARKNTLEAERLAIIDPLTKLYNRRALEIALEIEIVRQKRYGGFFSLALIDLDGFKMLNDSKGHQSGDTALLLLADLLREHTRESDTISRIGGDEFVILMPNTHSLDCQLLCELLNIRITKAMITAGFNITASIGYTTIEQTPSLFTDVLSDADKAMYKAKFNGKGRVVRG